MFKFLLAIIFVNFCFRANVCCSYCPLSYLREFFKVVVRFQSCFSTSDWEICYVASLFFVILFTKKVLLSFTKDANIFQNEYQFYTISLIRRVILFKAVFTWLIFCPTHMTFRPEKRDKWITPWGQALRALCFSSL